MWKMVKLGEICDVLDSLRKPITKKDRVAGDHPYYGATGIVDWVEDYIFDEKLVLVGEDGAKWGSGDTTAFIATGKYWVNNHAHVLRPMPELVIHEWISYYLTGIDLSEFVTGLTVPKLNQANLRTIPIPLPPLAEQQRIVAKLDAAFGEIDKAIKLNEHKKENAADAHAAYMEQVFRASLLEYKQSTLGELCEFHNGKAHEKDISEDGEFYVVNSKFISSDGTVAKYTNKQMFPLITGDIVMVMSDVPNGKALAKAMQINEDGKYSLNQRICCIRSNHYHPQFLQTVLNRHPHFLKFNNGENQTNLRKNDILECPLPVIPLSGQISLLQSIQLLTEETHKLSKIYNAQSRNYDALKSAILAQELQSEAA